jgi:hypothetical protein
MRNTVTAVLMGVMLVVAVGNISAQIAGSTTPGMSVEELKTIARGWSATKQILGKPVYNDKNEKVGDVDDLIIAPDSSISYAIIGVGGFLGLGERQVAVPVNRFKAYRGEDRAAGRDERRPAGHAVIPIRSIKALQLQSRHPKLGLAATAAGGPFNTKSDRAVYREYPILGKVQ